jgi:plasmid stabilization system protein ParE
VGFKVILTSIADFPERGLVVPEIGNAAVPEIVHGKYRIIYQPLPAGRLIIRRLSCKHSR